MQGIVRGGLNEGDYSIGDSIHYTKLGLVKVPKFGTQTIPARLCDYGWAYYITFSSNVISRYSVIDDSLINSFTVATPSGYNMPSCRRPDTSGGIDVDCNGNIFIFFRHTTEIHQFYVKKYSSNGLIISEGVLSSGYYVATFATVSFDGAAVALVTSQLTQDQWVKVFNTMNYSAIWACTIEYSLNDHLRTVKLSNNASRIIVQNTVEGYLYSIDTSGKRTTIVSITGYDDMKLIGCWADGLLFVSYYFGSGKLVKINSNGLCEWHKSGKHAFASNGKLYQLDVVGNINRIDALSGNAVESLGVFDIKDELYLNHVSTDEITYNVSNSVFKTRFIIQE